MNALHTPLLAGFAAIQQRETDLTRSKEAAQLMIDAVRLAAEDCGGARLLSRVQRIYVPQGMWQYSDPARLVADAIGAESAISVLAQIGILQQTLIADACERISRGEIECAVVVGGEAKFRQLQASIQQCAIEDSPQTCTPDHVMQPEAELWLEAENDAGLMMPVGFYAVIESALRHANGEAMEAHRDRIAQRYQHFSEIAAANPQAWKREPLTAAQIRDAAGKNRMLAFPYTKAHNTEWNVDQAAALILCSEALADEFGIAQQNRLYPVASSESNHMQCLSQREHLHRSPGAELSLQAALKHADMGLQDIRWVDLYSCFPCAVQIYADALGTQDSDPAAPNYRQLTVTGGMPFAGGPLNNYIYQSTCKLAEQLRAAAHRGEPSSGLISCVSGMLTKQAWGVWSTEKPAKPFASIDVTAAVKAASAPKSVLNHYQGPASIAGYTVLYEGNAPSRAVIVADTPDQQRVVAWSDDAASMQAMMREEHCAKAVHIQPHGQFSLAAE